MDVIISLFAINVILRMYTILNKYILNKFLSIYPSCNIKIDSHLLMHLKRRNRREVENEREEEVERRRESAKRGGYGRTGDEVKKREGENERNLIEGGRRGKRG